MFPSEKKDEKVNEPPLCVHAGRAFSTFNTIKLVIHNIISTDPGNDMLFGVYVR